MAGLYSGLANGGQFAPPHDPPRPARARAGAPGRPGGRLVRRRHPGRRAAAGGLRRRCRSACASGASPTRPAPRPASATPGRPATRANWTVVVWVGHADGTPRPGQLGRLAALPVPVQGLRPPAGRGQSRPAAAGRRAARRLQPRPAAAHAHARACGDGRGRPAHRLSAARRAHRARARTRPCRSAPMAATASCAGWSTASRSTARHLDARRARHGAGRGDRRPGPLERRHVRIVTRQ